MNILLDSHLLIWALNGDSRLSNQAKALLLDPDNTIYYNVVSIWEYPLSTPRIRIV